MLMSEVQSFENDDTANAESIRNMASNESFYQLSVRSWQLWYHIKAPNGRSSFMYNLKIFSCCHGNGS